MSSHNKSIAMKVFIKFNLVKLDVTTDLKIYANYLFFRIKMKLMYFKLLWNFSNKFIQFDTCIWPPWRNWLARSAVNRKVGGSSPPGGVFLYFQSHFSLISFIFTFFSLRMPSSFVKFHFLSSWMFYMMLILLLHSMCYH